MDKVVIIDYGAGNVQSVKFALERLGVNAELSSDPDIVMGADKIIFPGVGEARSAMEEVKKTGLEKLIPELKQPFLGICLGMQLMCRFSHERDTECLGVFDEEVRLFNLELKVPHMGWNTISSKNSKLLKGIKDDSYFYFVHSYYVSESKYTVGTCHYGHPFSAIIERDNFYGCQFHPEKSSKEGAILLQNFLNL